MERKQISKSKLGNRLRTVLMQKGGIERMEIVDLLTEAEGGNLHGATLSRSVVLVLSRTKLALGRDAISRCNPPRRFVQT